MSIAINPDLRIVSDAFGWTVEQRSVTKKGKRPGTELWAGIGHHGSLEQAICWLLKSRLHLLSGAERVTIGEVGMMIRTEARKLAAVVQKTREL